MNKENGGTGCTFQILKQLAMTRWCWYYNCIHAFPAEDYIIEGIIVSLSVANNPPKMCYLECYCSSFLC